MDTLTHTEQVQNLFVKNISQIRGFIFGLVPDFAAAEDVLQEVFLVITRRADTFEIETNFMGWAYGIARLKAKEFIRREKQLPDLLSEEAMDALAEVGPEDETGWDVRRQALADCLKAVAPKAREVMELRYVQGLLPGQIAKEVSWSMGAVNVQLSRVRKYLRECSRRKLATEGL
ncbi:MAG: RNA polymerase subunit sigma-24 [Verrucomicrobia bacterium]|nr:RNA polymerase subunit sigma-24 [Verrucomicrobiota bacterium]